MIVSRYIQNPYHLTGYLLVAPFDIDDVVPEPDKIADAICGLKNGKSPGPSRVRAEHLKEWVREAYRGVDPYQVN